MADIKIDGNTLTIEQAVSISRGQYTASVAAESKERMRKSRAAVEEIIRSGDTVYGINTGFGAMSSVRIDDEEIEALQENLVRSHACGVGDKMDPEHVMLMMVFRANSIAKGVSGARPELVEHILSMVNSRISPDVPRIGSLGASGDLAPLSHMALSMMGEGNCSVYDNGSWKHQGSKEALANAGLKPIKLLSLIHI